MVVGIAVILIFAGIIMISNKGSKETRYEYETIKDYSNENGFYGRLMVINPNDVVIENDDKYFYESVDKNFQSYKAVCKEALKYKKYVEAGYSIAALKSLGFGSQQDTFGTTAIRGAIYDGKVFLSNGRHRCVVAKRLGIPVIMYISGEYRTVKM